MGGTAYLAGTTAYLSNAATYLPGAITYLGNSDNESKALDEHVNISIKY